MAADFDFVSFLRARWPTVGHLVRFAGNYGVVLPSDHALHKWYSRDAIPSSHFAVLLTLLEIEQGAPVSIAEFLKK